MTKKICFDIILNWEVKEWIYVGEQNTEKILKKRSFHIASAIYVRRTQIKITKLSVTYRYKIYNPLKFVVTDFTGEMEKKYEQRY